MLINERKCQAIRNCESLGLPQSESHFNACVCVSVPLSKSYHAAQSAAAEETIGHYNSRRAMAPNPCTQSGLTGHL